MKVNNKATRVFAYCLFGAIFSCAVVHATQGSMLTSFIEHYTLESAAQGTPSAAQSFGQAASLFIMFWLAGRISKQALIKISFVVAVLVLFFISLIPSFVVLCLLYGVFGLTFGAINTGSSSLISDLFEGADSTKYMSRLHGALGLGWLVAPLFYLIMFNSGYNWNIIIRITTFILAAILIAHIVASHFSLKSIQLSKATNQKISWLDIKAFFKGGSGIILILCIFFYAAHQSATAVWINRYISVYLNGPSLGAWSLSLFWVGIVIARFTIHKVPVEPIKTVLFGNIAAAVILFGSVFARSAVVITICAPIVGLLNGVTIPVILSISCADNKGNATLPTTLLNLALFLGQAISQLIVGALVYSISIDASFFFSALCAFLCGVFVFFYLKNVRSKSSVQSQ